MPGESGMSMTGDLRAGEEYSKSFLPRCASIAWTDRDREVLAVAVAARIIAANDSSTRLPLVESFA